MSSERIAGDPPATEAELGSFFQRLEGAAGAVLLVDYDGTLAPFRRERAEAVPYPGIRERLRRILGAGRSRLVVVSGRAVEDLRPLLGLEPPPEIWGSHGWERLRPGGGLERFEPPREAREGLLQAEEALRELVRENVLEADQIEKKPVSVAAHVRGLPRARARSVLDSVRTAWGDVGRGPHLEAHSFSGGLELRVSGRDKGTAVQEILASEPADAPAAYLGDDLTDEDAFREMKGRGLSVLVREDWRETLADAWLRPPDELLAFLDRWHEHTSVE